MEVKSIFKRFKTEKGDELRGTIELAVLQTEIDSTVFKALEHTLVSEMTKKILPSIEKKIILDKEFMDKVKENIEFLVAKNILNHRMSDAINDLQYNKY